MSLAFFNTLLVTFLSLTMKDKGWTEQEKQSQAFYCYIQLAIGTMLGSVVLGWVMDKKGYHASLLLILVVSVIVLLGCIWYNEVFQFSWTAHLVAFGWGFLDAVYVNFINAVLGFEFESMITPFAA